MTDGYRAVRAACERETVIQRSRFLARIAPVASEEEARAEIAAVRKAHPFATHVCYAFVADPDGRIMRSSDGGEPQGTAGVPILEVLRARGLRSALVTVTRYFGGVKLGAGGLARAYARAAGEAADAAETAEMIRAARYRFRIGYDALKVYEKAAETLPGEETARAFGEKVDLERAVPLSEAEKFCGAIADLFGGKASAEKTGEEFFPFRTNK